MKLIPLTTWILLFFAASFAEASEKLKVKFDCYLPGDAVSCSKLESAYKNLSTIESVENDPMLSVTVHRLPIANGTRYEYSLVGTGSLPTFNFSYDLSENLNADEVFEKVLGMLETLTEPYLKIFSIGQGVTPTENESPWSLSPSIVSNFDQKQGNTTLAGQFTADGGYTTQKWRVGAGVASAYSLTSTETTAFNTGVKSEVFAVGGGAGVIRTIRNHWSIAVLMQSTNVVSNTELKDKDLNDALPENAKHNEANALVGKVGVEWVLVPFLTENSNGNISVRYLLGGEKHRFVDPETYEYAERAFLEHILQVTVARHFKKVDVNFSVRTFSETSFRDYMGASSSINLKYMMDKDKRFSISPNFSVQYTKGQIPSPAAGTSFVTLTSGVTQAWAKSGGVTLSYLLIKPSKLTRQDQRWK